MRGKPIRPVIRSHYADNVVLRNVFDERLTSVLVNLAEHYGKVLIRTDGAGAWLADVPAAKTAPRHFGEILKSAEQHIVARRVFAQRRNVIIVEFLEVHLMLRATILPRTILAQIATLDYGASGIL